MSGQPPDNPEQQDQQSGAPTDPTSERASASGLIAQQLDPQDMAELCGQFRFNSVPLASPACRCNSLSGWELAPGLPASALEHSALGLRSPAPLRLRMAPLPGRVRSHALRLESFRPRLNRDPELALAMPVRRRRVAPDELSTTERDAVNKAMIAKYGNAVRELTLAAVFREVPAEAARLVRLDESLRYCQFTLPPGTKVAQLRSGCALVLATGESGKTYPALARL